MFAKTLGLVAFSAIIASIPTAVADAPCTAAEGFEVLCVAYDVMPAPEPMPGQVDCAVPLGERCLVASQPSVEAVLPQLPAYERPSPDLSFAWLNGEAHTQANGGFVPSIGSCITVYPYSAVCNLLP